MTIAWPTTKSWLEKTKLLHAEGMPSAMVMTPMMMQAFFLLMPASARGWTTMEYMAMIEVMDAQMRAIQNRHAKMRPPAIVSNTPVRAMNARPLLPEAQASRAPCSPRTENRPGRIATAASIATDISPKPCTVVARTTSSFFLA